MTGRSMSRMIGSALVLAIVALTGMAAADAQAKGRYKKQGANCVWDANDTGPNQCTPAATGRFKKDGANCVWDATGSGADQCRPQTGRFKKSGTKCEWSAKDSGPDQCDPRKTTK
jgi:hypothetical protein